MPGVRSRGRFVTLEGVDGAGKSTHLPWIAERMRAHGRDVLVTREPGGSALAERLRALVLGEAMDPLCETLLMFAARADHLARTVLPALEGGTWVLCDRFTDSTCAYQGGGKGVPAQLIERLAAHVHPGLEPDRTLLFDCAYEVSRARLAAAGRPPDRFEAETREFFERVRAVYRRLAEANPQRIRLIDGARPPEEVRALIESALAGL